MKKINRWFLTATLLFLIMCSVVINSKSVYADSVDVIDYVFGDVNGDKSVTAKDRIILSRYLAGWDGYEAIDEFAADVNLDGKTDLTDLSANLILFGVKYFATSSFLISKRIVPWCKNACFLILYALPENFLPSYKTSFLPDNSAFILICANALSKI